MFYFVFVNIKDSKKYKSKQIYQYQGSRHIIIISGGDLVFLLLVSHVRVPDGSDRYIYIIYIYIIYMVTFHKIVHVIITNM